MIQWHIEKRKLSDLKDHPKNPRKLDKDQAEHLQKSLEKFGLIDKPIINLDNQIIGGHQRKNILKKMKLKEVECFVPDHLLDHNEVDELNIRLNKNTGDWDYDVLKDWDSDKLVDWGFYLEDLGQVIEEILPEDEDESELLEPPKDPVTVLGDLYELNNHRLVCGDSTLPEYVEKCLAGAEPILMVTDPPYGVNYDPGWRQKHNTGYTKAGKVKNDDKIDWSLAWCLFPGSICYVWHGGKFAGQVQKSLEDCEFVIVAQIIWGKQQFVFSRGDYHWQHEPCWYAVKKGHNHGYVGDRKQSTLWQIDNLNPFGKGQDKEDVTAHSTQKPIECMARPIRNNTAKGEGVYDPFLGSGTTLIAAEQLERTCYGLELDPSYCDIIVDRWKRFMEKNKIPYTIKKNGEKI